MNIDLLVVFFAKYFPYVVAALFVCVVFWLAKSKREQVVFFVEGAVAALISRGAVEVIRLFVHRPRPFVADSSIVPLISEASYSFPSGHASFFFALSTVIFLHNKRWGVSFYVASLLIGLARIAAGVHYPTDILGGAVLGIIVGWLTHKLFLHFHSRA